MSETERCSRCDTRIHPLDVSDLHRGRTLECHHCGAELKAQTRASAAVAAGLVISTAVTLPYWIFPASALLSTLVITIVLPLINWMTPPGLVAGAPWVRIRASEPESDQAWQAEARERIRTMRRENTGGPSDQAGQ